MPNDIKPPTYSPNLVEQFPDLEILNLRKQLKELAQKLETANAVLKEHGLEELTPKPISQEEEIAVQQISKLHEMSSKGFPFSLEETKNYETLVKTLLAIRGKPVVEEKKSKKKEEKPDIAKLLSIAGDKKFERD